MVENGIVEFLSIGFPVSMVKKVKEVDLYSAFIVVPHTQGAQVRITQCYLQITPYLLFLYPVLVFKVLRLS